MNKFFTYVFFLIPFLGEYVALIRGKKILKNRLPAVFGRQWENMTSKERYETMCFFDTSGFFEVEDSALYAIVLGFYRLISVLLIPLMIYFPSIVSFGIFAAVCVIPLYFKFTYVLMDDYFKIKNRSEELSPYW